MSRRLSLLLLCLASCGSQAGSVRINVPIPVVGPLKVDVEWGNQINSLERSPTGENRTVAGVDYEVYVDNKGGRWLRDPRPPHKTVPESAVTGISGRTHGGIVNSREATRLALVDFAGWTGATLSEATRLSQVTGRTGASESFHGATVLYWNPESLEATVRYPMRANIGIPHPEKHKDIRYCLQVWQGMVWVTVEGDVRKVAGWLLAQGIVELQGVPLQFEEGTYEVDVRLSRTAVTFWWQRICLRTILL